MDSATWLVQLFLYGPLSVTSEISLSQEKTRTSRRQFQSNVHIRNAPSGVRMSVTTRAHAIDPAKKAALVFVGEMVDVLAGRLNLPVRVSLYESDRGTTDRHSVKRILTPDEIRDAFERARWLGEHHPAFLRALSWFRKGLTTEDPLDRFFAFWLSLENVASQYHPDVPEASKGSKSQLWESFKSLWGDVATWPVIPGNSKWIDENYEQRIKIAHGTAPVDVDAIEGATIRGEVARQVAHRFLSDWSQKFPTPGSDLPLA